MVLTNQKCIDGGVALSNSRCDFNSVYTFNNVFWVVDPDSFTEEQPMDRMLQIDSFSD